MANPNTNLASSDALDVTKFAAWGSGIAGVVAAVAAVIAKLAKQNWPVELLLALIAFAAVAFVVLGAVVITDMLVRRDLAKNVVPTTGNDPALPLLYQVWKELKPDLEKAASALDAIAKDEVRTRRTAELVRAATSRNGPATRIIETR
jgi:hypothetical protein